MDKFCPICGELLFGNKEVHPRCYQKYYHKQRRSKIIAHYGGKCAVCHKDKDLILAYKDPSKSKLTGSKLYTYILNNNYPDEFEVLCQSCLYSKIVDLNEPRKQETILRRLAKKQERINQLDLEQAYGSVDFKRRRKRRY